MWTFIQYFLTVLIMVIAIGGDHLVFKTFSSGLYKALADNVIHGIIGCLSWSIVCLTCKNRLIYTSIVEIALCTMVSSLIDIDHFISAHSLKLKDAVNLQKRPFLHCSTIPFILLLIIYFIGINNDRSTYIHRLLLVLFCAFISHHTRDAVRHGYWMFPFGSTLPLPYIFYITLICLIPYISIILLSNINSSHSLEQIEII